jgi:hypothetical protein
MNLQNLLLLPWMAWSMRTRRIIALAMLVVLAIAATAYALRGTPDAGRLHLIRGLAIFDAILWALVLPRGLQLANEAHRLRVPELGRQAVGSTALYVALSIALPTAIVTLAGGSLSVVLTELALGAGIGMGYAALPYWLGFWACLTPSLGDSIGAWLPLPSTDPVGFLHWAAPLAAGLWALIALSWRHVVRSGDDALRWFTPAVLRWRRFSTIGRNAAQLEREMLRRRGARNQPRASLRLVGPGHATTSLRMALGGWSMPQTAAGRLRTTGLVLAQLLLVFVVLAVVRRIGHDTDLRHLLDLLLGPAPLVWGASLFGIMLGWARADALRARWSRGNGELAVLALLPGLGDAARIRRALLQASLLPVLGMQAALFTVTLLAGAWLDLPASSDALLLLAHGGGMLTTVCLGVAALGGTMLPRGWQSVLAISAVVLMLSTVVLALPPFDRFALAQHPDALQVFAALWASLLVILLAIGRRGWRAFRHRPHPFLPNTD